MWSGVGPQVNKFEQVSSTDHQMSVVGVGLMFRGVLYHVANPMMHVMYPLPPLIDRMMDRRLGKH